MTILPPETQADGKVWSAGPIGPGWRWLHYDLVHAAARCSIEALHTLPEDARDTLVATDESFRLDVAGQTVFGVLPGLQGNLDDDAFMVSAWRFAVTPDTLVTARRTPISTLGACYRHLERDASMESPALLIDHAISGFTDVVRQKVAALAHQLDEAEDALLGSPSSLPAGLGSTIGKIRRRATRIKRVMAPLDRAIRSDDAVLPEWDIQSVFERLQRQIHAVADDLFALQDRARSLQDELSSRQAEDSNRRLYIVSIVTTLLLPATFVTGFFGMNTGGMFLTGTHGHSGTIMAGLICLLSFAAMFGFLKIRRLL